MGEKGKGKGKGKRRGWDRIRGDTRKGILGRENVQAAMEGQYNAVPVFAVADADDVMPACWKLDKNRPLTAVDLERIKGSGGGLKGWVTSRLGGEDAPGICGHTDGSGATGIERWNSASYLTESIAI